VSVQIWHLPFSHGNFAPNLDAAERSLGLERDSVAPPHPYAPDASHLLGSDRARHPRDFIERLKLLAKVRRSADIVHFNYGSSLLDPPWRRAFLLDLGFYSKRIRKVMTFQGSDVRMAYDPEIELSREYERSLGHQVNDTTAGGQVPQDEVERKQAIVRKADRHMDRIFTLNPDLLDFLPDRADHLPYPTPFIAGLRSSEGTASFDGTRKLRVLHVSTNRVLKGTGLIEQALKDAAQHLPLEYRVHVKVNYSEVMAGMDWCDVFIDQVGIGWYGAQAVEALILGKPVLCYLREDHRQAYLPKGETGIVNTKHGQIGAALADLIDNPDRLQSLARAGRDFAQTFHDPIQVVHKLYDGWI